MTSEKSIYDITISDQKRASNLHLQVRYGSELLFAVLANEGIPGWNSFVERLHKGGVYAAFSSPDDDGDDCTPVVIRLDFTRVDFRGLPLDGIDLDLALCDGADFSNASLRGARVAGEEAIFHGADLRDAVLPGNVSGADFQGALVDGIQTDTAWYCIGKPPRGLPDELLRGLSALPLNARPPNDPYDAERDPQLLTMPARSSHLVSFWGQLKNEPRVSSRVRQLSDS